MTRIRRLVHDETGSTLPLVIFFCFLGLVVILGAAGATSLYLERTRLYSVADGAALAAAEAFDLASVRATARGFSPSLTDADVAAAAAEFLAGSTHPELEDLRLEEAVTADGLGATVRVSAWWRPPVLSPFLPEGIRLEATSSARSVFG